MVQTLITFLTVTTFVAHGLFGCCWHHGHTHLMGGLGSPHERAATHGDGCHRHSHHVSSEAAETGHDCRDSHRPSQPGCAEGHCVFVRTQDRAAGSVDASAPILPHFNAVLAGSLRPTPKALPMALAVPAVPPPFSVPLYALHEAWLI